MNEIERISLGDRINKYDKLIEKIKPQLKAIEFIKRHWLDEGSSEGLKPGYPSIELIIDSTGYKILMWGHSDSAEIHIDEKDCLNATSLLKSVAKEIFHFLNEEIKETQEKITEL